MINREITSEFKKLLKEYPIVTILGPRQSGKTTLAKMSLKKYEYCNLENPEDRQYALDDPKAFLSQFSGKVILDEIQRVPILLSYIQTIVDNKKLNGQFVLTGSHQLEIQQAISQSLAGRTAILHLLPLSIKELDKAGIKYSSFEDYVIKGFLPRVYDQNQRPTVAYSNYYQTYVERDVRQLIKLKNVTLFEKFIKLLAGRVGQLIDYNSFAGDVGVDAKTIKEWLAILEASFVIFKLPPFYKNFGKRVIKSLKYYFIDVGLLVFLLGIEKTKQIKRDPLFGNIFENLVVIEALKSRFNKGRLSNLYFFRDSNGKEIDLLCNDANEIIAIEIKAAETYHPSFFKNLDDIKNFSENVTKTFLIYNGQKKSFKNSGHQALCFNQIDHIFL
ncbi:AAA family ATPase [bacterium K02(2017)]|nr:AAA family ATPase [bacterium K02(2017)]